MSALADFLRWLRVTQTQACLDYCDARVIRAKEDLHNAMVARDMALAHARVNEPVPTVPAFLLKKDAQ